MHPLKMGVMEWTIFFSVVIFLQQTVVNGACLNNTCHADATCVDIDSVAFVCACNIGFIGNGTSCSDSTSVRYCHRFSDLVFVLDASDNGRPIFQAQKKFIKDVAGTYLITQPKSRAAIVAYAAQPIVITKLDAFTDIATFFATVDNIPVIGGTPDMGRALITASSLFALQSDDAEQIPILINSGPASQQSSLRNSVVGSMRALGHKPVLVGVGDTADMSALREMSAIEPKYVFGAPTINEFLSESLRNGILDLTCPESNACLLSNPCDGNATCISTNTSTGYFCQCKPGFEKVGSSCKDIDNCLLNPCAPNAKCENTVGSYNCTCEDGYTGNGFVSCNDTDECLGSPCDPNAVCSNFAGGFGCTCKFGYSGDGFTCKDVDECLGKPCDANADCLNVPGGFNCTCKTGYSGNGFSCQDRDECQLDKPCDANAQCSNTVGSFECVCGNGYEGTGLQCKDINECDQNLCDVSATCSNTNGSFACSCAFGLAGDGFVCRDIDECLQNKCHPFANCKNTYGSFRCTCKEGYSGDGISVCKESLLSCNGKADLVFLVDGSDNGAPIFEEQKDLVKYIGASFLLQGESRAAVVQYAEFPQRDIGLDEFKDIGTFNASVDRLTPKGGRSILEKAFAPIMSEFALHSQGGIKKIAMIMNAGKTEGNQQLQNDLARNQRALGYTMVIIGLGNKVDFAELSGIAGGNISKLLLAPTVKALEDSGQIQLLNREVCPEVDECSQTPAPCHPFAICNDTRLSYTCTCMTGYQGDGKQCTDIDECLADPCSQHATCTNTRGSFVCECKRGFVGNGFSCTDVDECLDRDICDKNAVCTNSIGSFSCDCLTGFTGNGFTCTDNDECLSNPCNVFADCKNTPGSFECECRIGFSGDGFSCTDVDECQVKPPICGQNALCSNTIGSYVCTCEKGFARNALGVCIDIDECQFIPPICGQHATCVNTRGSHVCICDRGYVKDPTGLCKDDDECQRKPCHADASCTNTPGSFRCTCNQGFRGDGTNCSVADNFCNYENDLVFLIDSSDNAKDIFERQKELLKTVAHAFTSKKRSRVAVVSYADFPRIDTSLDSYIDEKTFDVAVDNIKFIGGPSRIDRSLATAISQFSLNPSDKSQIAILFVAGLTDGDKSLQRDLAENMRDLGYQLFVKGLTTKVNTDELVEIAGGNNSYLLLPKSIEDLFGAPIIDRLVTVACPEENECNRNPPPCDKNAKCTDSLKSYTCDCNTGYIGSGAPGDCKDIDECLSSPCSPHASCINTPGSFRCGPCKKGFTGNGFFCTDVDECLQKPNPCHVKAKCFNNIGSYRCVCEKGFEGNGTFCTEVRYRDWGDWTVCSVTCGGLRKRYRNCTVSKTDFPNACPGASEETRSCGNNCHVTDCPDHNAGQFFTFEDKHRSMVHGANKTWHIHMKTPTVHTGPAYDNTFKSAMCGHFLYFEASKCPPDAYGFVETPPQRPKSLQYCLQFYLSMYSNVFPDQMGTLTLYLFQYMQRTRQVFHHGGVTTRNRTHWREVNIDLFLANSTMPFGVQFMAKQGSSIHSDIAIDDIALTPGICSGPVDGNWGQWGPYLQCNATCGSGMHVKRRGCNSPSARNNGRPCTGNSEMTKPCKKDPCKVNGTWTEWQEWGACSIRCDQGRRSRFRECFNTKARRTDVTVCYRMDGTVGQEEEESMQCSKATCKPEGRVHDWSKWSKCSASCDYGLRYRSGKCSVVDGCNGILTESEPCAIKACHVAKKYGEWTEWSKCSTTCGEGKEHRKRYCPMVEGCKGNPTEVRDCEDTVCHMDNCPRHSRGAAVYDFENGKKLIHSDPPTWKIGNNRTHSLRTGPMGDATWLLKPECGHYIYYEASRRNRGDVGVVSTQLRVPLLLKNCLSFALNMYTLYPEEMGSFTVSIHQNGESVKELFHHKGVMEPNENKWTYINLDIVLKDLRPFSIIFKAVRGIGFHGDISLDDIMLNHNLCEGPVHGEWGAWSDFSLCSQTCGGGEQVSRRECSSRNGGKDCEGMPFMTRACNEHPCPVNGSWCEWGLWNECTMSCGGGVRRRVRECTNPKPVAPGLDCPLPDGTRGVHQEMLGPCNDQACDVDGNWGLWENSICSSSCTYNRVRHCNNPAPAGHGKACAVEAIAEGVRIIHRMKVQNETLPCFRDLCPKR